MTAPAPPLAMAAEEAWPLLLCAREMAAHIDDDHDWWFAPEGPRALRRVAPDDATAIIRWRAGAGWESTLPDADPRAEFVRLYLPICSATPERPLVIGHLGQSVDGFIATHSGDSQFVTGHENIVHLHRLRALCDAVVVGPGTVAADNPQLTTRHVSGPNPLRVVFDMRRRLTVDRRLFTDDAAPTLYVTSRAGLAAGAAMGRAECAGVDGADPAEWRAALMTLLRARGCARIFIEGGGVTVSAFLGDGLLDRLHVAIAPVLIGDGRPAIRLAAPSRLRDCARPAYQAYRMGGDVLFDFDLREQPAVSAAPPGIARIL